MNLPLITVTVSSYNNARFIEETLDSIHAQTYPLIELVIVDDCSTDNSVEVVKSWLAKHSNRFQNTRLVVNPVNKGVSYVSNQMIENASGQFLSMIASDDLMVPEKLTAQYNLIKNDDAVAMVYSDCMMIDESGNMMHPSMFTYYRGQSFNPVSGDIFLNVLQDFYFYLQCCLIRTASIQQIGYRFKMKVLSEDWDIQLALSRSFKAIGNRDVVVKYRKVSTSLTSNYWTEDRFHEVYRSHFVMLYPYYQHQLNSDSDRRQILDKLRELYWKMSVYKKCTNREKFYYHYQLFKLSKSVRDLYVSCMMLLGGNPLHRLGFKKKATAQPQVTARAV